MRYLIVDGMLSGTGVRDIIEGGYISLSSLSLSDSLKKEFDSWLKEYENEHFFSYSNLSKVKELDKWGMHLAKQLTTELADCKIGYYSAAFNKMIIAPSGSLQVKTDS